MEQPQSRPLMSEDEAAEYLGISMASLRNYVMTGSIPALLKIQSARGGSRGRHRYVYEFSPKALDAYDAQRREGKKSRNRPRFRKEGVTNEGIGEYLNDTTLTLREIGEKAGLSDESIRQIGEKLGIEKKIRVRRRRDERIQRQNKKRYEEFLEKRPPWYMEFQKQCDERGIVFKPYALLRDGAVRFSYYTALCNRHLVHLYYGTLTKYGRQPYDYVRIRVGSAVPEAHFVAGVGVQKEDRGEEFYFWIIPSSFINERRKQHSGYLYLAPPRQVRRRFDLEGEENTRSPWAQWYERWDLLSP